MTKKEMEKKSLMEDIKKVTGELFDLELTEEQIELIENSQEPTKTNVKKLNSLLDLALKELEKDGKKAVFKWVSIKDFYKMKLQSVTFDKIKVGYKISFRLDSKKIDLIKDAFCYCDGKDTELDTIDFENGQDVCTVEKIDKKKKSIFVKSDNYGGLWELSPIDFDGKYNKCVIKNGSNIAFLVYAPIEK